MKDKKMYDSLPVKNKIIDKMMPGGYVTQWTPSQQRANDKRAKMAELSKKLSKITISPKKEKPSIKDRFMALKKGL